MVHGQCTGVGVGGFLLGGGYNLVGTSARLGTGSENVMQYTMVDARGDVYRVNGENTTKLHQRGYQSPYQDEREVTDDANLFMALKGAGKSEMK